MSDKLHKSKNNRVLAGVCGGIAEYFNVDPTLIRLAWVLAVFFGGSGLVLYILAMIIIPEEKPVLAKKSIPMDIEAEGSREKNEEEEQMMLEEGASQNESQRHQLLGLILVGLGGYFLIERFFPYFRLHYWWPVILIVIGVAILFRSLGGNGR
jgi:phage shock protein C